MANRSCLFGEQLIKFGINMTPTPATAPDFKNDLLDKFFIVQTLDLFFGLSFNSCLIGNQLIAFSSAAFQLL
jgi:hypothetical protein